MRLSIDGQEKSIVQPCDHHRGAIVGAYARAAQTMFPFCPDDLNHVIDDFGGFIVAEQKSTACAEKIVASRHSAMRAANHCE